MADTQPFVLADVLLDGRRIDLLVTRQSLLPIDPVDNELRRIDCRGGRLLPGLVDHHLHLFAAAAEQRSTDLSAIYPSDPLFAEAIRIAASRGPVRATGVDDADRLDRGALDAMVRDRPVRVLARTGGLWVLNGAALDELLDRAPDATDHIERDTAGRPTGRIWNGDTVLRAAASPPDLAPIRDSLNRWGITAVCDASITTDQPQAEAIAAACAAAGLRQRLTLMGGHTLTAGSGSGWSVGPRKILLHDADLPSLAWFEEEIALARSEARNVAVHCVTAAETALALAAFTAAGVVGGDRIEHGAMIDAASIPVIAELGLTVVSNPAFIRARGDRYGRTIDAAEIPDLYRLASLAAGGVAIRGASDAPYGPLNPWIGMRAAGDRRTASGAALSPAEALTPEAALDLYLPGDPNPSTDVIVLRPGARVGIDEDPVALTIIGGEIVYQAAENRE